MQKPLCLDPKVNLKKSAIKNFISGLEHCLELTETCTTIDLIHANIVFSIQECQKDYDSLPK